MRILAIFFVLAVVFRVSAYELEVYNLTGGQVESEVHHAIFPPGKTVIDWPYPGINLMVTPCCGGKRYDYFQGLTNAVVTTMVLTSATGEVIVDYRKTPVGYFNLGLQVGVGFGLVGVGYRLVRGLGRGVPETL